MPFPARVRKPTLPAASTPDACTSSPRPRCASASSAAATSAPSARSAPVGTADAPLPVIAETYFESRRRSGLFWSLAAAAARSTAATAPAAVRAATLAETMAAVALLAAPLVTGARTAAIDKVGSGRSARGCVKPVAPPALAAVPAAAARSAPARLRAVTAPSADAPTEAVSEAAAGEPTAAVAAAAASAPTLAVVAAAAGVLTAAGAAAAAGAPTATVAVEVAGDLAAAAPKQQPSPKQQPVKICRSCPTWQQAHQQPPFATKACPPPLCPQRPSEGWAPPPLPFLLQSRRKLAQPLSTSRPEQLEPAWARQGRQRRSYEFSPASRHARQKGKRHLPGGGPKVPSCVEQAKRERGIETGRWVNG